MASLRKLKKRIKRTCYWSPFFYRFRYSRVVRRVYARLYPRVGQRLADERDLYAALLRQLPRPPKLCFDLGAYRGDISELFLRTGATVVALEPQPSLQRHLRGRFVGEARFVLVPKAVGATEGKQIFHLNTEQDARSTLSDAWHRYQPENRAGDGPQMEVPVTTLDALIGAYGVPEVLKIDVEGHERQVLSTLGQHPVALILFEANLALFLDDTLTIARTLLPSYQLGILCGAEMPDVWFDELIPFKEALTALAPRSVDVVTRRKHK